MHIRHSIAAVLVALLATACSATKTPTDPREPFFAAALFDSTSAAVTHPHFPLTPGVVRLYQMETEDGMETVVEEVLDVDTGEIVARDVAVVFVNCRRVLEWTPLEPYALEYKYYAPGVGLVREESIDGETLDRTLAD